MKLLMGVFGHPVAHSMSPVMHKAALGELNIEGSYEAYDIGPEELEDGIKSMKSEGYRGMNITLPHKVAVMDHLDAVSEEAEAIGAVNTIVNENGKLTGYNTDGQGFLDSVLEQVEDLSGKRVLLIGAGGASRAVAVSFARHGVKELAITNRTLSKANEIAVRCKKWCDSRVLPATMAQAAFTGYDLIINTTSIGMSPDVNRMPMSLETVKRNALVCDLIYNPEETRWLREAEKKGAKTLNGIGMFINQGALAFEMWTGKKAPREAMKQAVLFEMKKQQLSNK
ncbi:shikimate dehydrogenase [Alteribacter lacisalsi]|uniref:Shikimate dehydrogenase (NADP(+)) n=1 Tax=Alteribacter lacisalsi TaxID=2045244 RepID=A0A2W0HCV4_9BACI|nr:shikimate dehydrogenase [Alteribacter lacisalsi]PYZ98716.1 shikimate dehydrogenase [Alteribacter lacisalsi]